MELRKISLALTFAGALVAGGCSADSVVGVGNEAHNVNEAHNAANEAHNAVNEAHNVDNEAHNADNEAHN